jgi:hypothetical protein
MAPWFWRYNSIARMRRVALVFAVAVIAIIAFGGDRAYAQDPPPPLPHVVVDLQGLVPSFPNDSTQLADSRGLTVTELPGAGFGFRAGADLHFLKFKAVTLGVGGEVMRGTSSSTPVDPSAGLVAVDERLTSVASHLSFNFGSGHGWSYLSGGIGRSHWSLHPAGAAETSADNESLLTFNYGGGARWFAKTHLAFSLDARIYEIQPGTAVGGRPGSPRTRLFVFGAGISLK